MSLYKRKGSPYWWVRFTHNGRRVQQSAGTKDKAKAEQYHDRLKSSLWEQDRLGVKPIRSWNEAVVKWLHETSHKATHANDIAKLRWLDKYLGGRPLGQITRDEIGRIGEIKARHASGATANRTLALIRAILRRACYEWEWIDKAPKVRMFKERKRRVRWITRVEGSTRSGCSPSGPSRSARSTREPGSARSARRGSRSSDGTTFVTRGRAGTCRPERRSTSCKSSAAGNPWRWCAGTLIWRPSISRKRPPGSCPLVQN
jgi:hypothetical protein